MIIQFFLFIVKYFKHYLLISTFLLKIFYYSNIFQKYQKYFLFLATFLKAIATFFKNFLILATFFKNHLYWATFSPYIFNKILVTATFKIKTFLYSNIIKQISFYCNTFRLYQNFSKIFCYNAAFFEDFPFISTFSIYGNIF